MNPPQLPLHPIRRKRRPRMHHTRIIRNQHIPLLPPPAQTNPSIIHQIIHHLYNRLLVVLDHDLARRVFGLALGPTFVPAEAGDAGDGVRDHERHVAHFTAPVADAKEAPADGLQAGEGVGCREVLEEKARFGEEGVA